MKQIFILFFLFYFLNGSSQSISNSGYQLPDQSILNSKELKKINLLLKNKKNRVKLVSLKPFCWIENEIVDTIEVQMNVCHFSSIISNSDHKSVDLKRIKTSSDISVEDFSSILSIFYEKKTDSSHKGSHLCYEPRHGILIYNSKEKVKTFFEICFECLQIKQVGKFPKTNGLTVEEFKELKRIFSKYMNDYITE